MQRCRGADEVDVEKVAKVESCTRVMQGGLQGASYRLEIFNIK